MELSLWQRVRTRAFLFAVGVRRRMTLGVRVVLTEGRRVHLIRQTYMPGWQFPGGGVEPGETAEACAARELLEETGYRPTGRMRLFGLYHNVSSVTNRDHVALYLCSDFERVHVFTANAEIAEADWFAIDRLPPGLAPGTASRLQEIFGEKAPSAGW